MNANYIYSYKTSILWTIFRKKTPVKNVEYLPRYSIIHNV